MSDGIDFDGELGEILSNIDTALDSYSPKPNRGPYQIDDAQLRRELQSAIGKLREHGYLTSQ